MIDRIHGLSGFVPIQSIDFDFPTSLCSLLNVYIHICALKCVEISVDLRNGTVSYRVHKFLQKMSTQTLH